MQFPVDTHTHTLASSHAYSSLHDYLAVAKEQGIKLFATTDHGPAMQDAPHFWHFVNLRVLPRLWNGVGILRGIEANIMDETGQIDYYGDYLKELDLVLAGFHEPVFAPKDRLAHTKAMIAAIESGLVDIISHPGNPAYPIDIEAVVTAAKAANVALEINNSSFNTSRKGSEVNCVAIAAMAAKLDAQLVMGSDAHVAFDLGKFDQALSVIEQAGYPKARLLNRSPEALLEFLISRGHDKLNELYDHFAR